MHLSDTSLPSNAEVDNIGHYPAGTVVAAAITATALAMLTGLVIAGFVFIGGSL